VCCCGALLVRRSKSDNGLAANQRRTIRVQQGLIDRRGDRLCIVAINVTDNLPAVGLKALCGVVRKPRTHLAIDRNIIVVIQADEFAELQRTGQRTSLVRYAFHQAAVAKKDPGPVIDDFMPRAIELGREHPFCHRHTNRVAKALSQWARRRLDGSIRLIFRVASGPGAHLPEVLKLLDREILVAGQMQQAV